MSMKSIASKRVRSSFIQQFVGGVIRGMGLGASREGAMRFMPLETMEERVMMASDPVITEFLASNQTGILDEDNESSDWIEIYNPDGADSLDLAGWRLTDDAGSLAKWTFPSVTINPGQHLVVFASAKDRTNPIGELHTNFQLDVDGEYLALVRPDGTTIQQAFDSAGGFYPQQLSDVSYGVSDPLNPGATQLYYFTPSPGAANSGPTTTDPTPRIVINEMMYHPASENDLDEWIELHNPGLADWNLSDWAIYNGVEYTFPSISIAPGGYLVVAADRTQFLANYPGVDPALVVGGWTGHLSNAGERVELADALGARVDQVEYAEEGDWADHRLQSTDAQGQLGWSWVAGHDGAGNSMELRNANLSNNHGQNWGSSVAVGGTPGAANSLADGDIAPLILEGAHWPLVPTSTDSVIITARILDELGTGLTVQVFSRVDNVGASFAPTTMVDDGTNGDAEAGDGIYTGVLMPQLNNRVVEFYISATDGAANSRTWPKATGSAGASQNANALYQVSNEASPVFPADPTLYRIIMTETERARLANIGAGNPQAQSNAQMNATFIQIDGTGSEVRYNAGVRNRGHGSRTQPPSNYHLNLANDKPIDGTTALLFNTKYTHAQAAGMAVHQLAGNVAPYATGARLLINGNDLSEDVGDNPNRMYGRYVVIEALNGEFADNHMPDDNDGNIYQARRSDTGGGEADLGYLGAAPGPYQSLYLKSTNETEADWSDIIALTNALNNSTTGTFIAAISPHVNIDQWVNYLAIDTLLGNRETGLNSGIGDDYALYRGVEDPRFMFLPHDLDTVMGQGNTGANPTQGVFQFEQVNGLNEFINHPEILPLYYAALLHHASTTFSAAVMNPMLDNLLTGWTTAAVITAMKNFAAARSNHVLTSAVPTARELTVTSSLPVQSGFAKSANGTTVGLSGASHPVNTRSIKVGGQAAAWNARTATWTMNTLQLNPGINRVIVQAFGPGDVELERKFIDIWYDDGSVANLSGTINTNTTLTAAGGPYRVTGNLTVASGARLTIEPGTSIYVDGGMEIVINGILDAQGTELQRIRITGVPGAAFVPDQPNGAVGLPDGPPRWLGLHISGSNSAQNILSYADIDYAQSANGSVGVLSGSQATLDNLSFFGTHLRMVYTTNSSVIVQNSYFPDMFNGAENPQTLGLDNISEHLKGTGGAPVGGYYIVRNNIFGTNRGHNDVVDLDSARRPNAILQVYGNIFFGAGDETIDLGGDAYIAHNIFMHISKDDTTSDRGYANAISTGDAGTGTTINVARNVFFDVDHAINLKIDTSTIFEYNTVAEIHPDFLDRFGNPSVASAINLYVDEPGAQPGQGAIARGNIFHQAQRVFGNADINSTSDLYAEYNLMDAQSAYAPVGMRPETAIDMGPGNFVGDARITEMLDVLRALTQSQMRSKPWMLGDLVTNYTSMADGSMAPGSGKAGADLGTLVNAGATIDGEPPAITTRTDATLIVGGAGIVSYQWRLDGGPWSAEITVKDPLVPVGNWDETIDLTGLSLGSHSVEVRGRNFAGVWQDTPTQSRTWNVDTALGLIRINEVLADNQAAHDVDGQFPDMIELYNESDQAVDLGNMSISDEGDEPRKHVFPPGTMIPARGYLALIADGQDLPGHVSFSLNNNGERVRLYGRARTGDVNNDSLANAADLDLVLGAIFNGQDIPAYDFTGDGHLTAADGQTLVQVVLGTLFGDANLNGSVSIGDLTVLAENFGLAGGWAQGDFNGDGSISIGDLTLLAENFNQSGAGPNPQPGMLLDEVNYGLQIPDHSIGRLGDGSWGLNVPTIGAANQRQVTGDPRNISINEWMASGDIVYPEQFIELYNRDALPVALGGMKLIDKSTTSDAQQTWDTLHPLSFIAAGGYESLIADGGSAEDHLNFKLDSRMEKIVLATADGQVVDSRLYLPQTTDYSQAPTAANPGALVYSDLPTPGALNPDGAGFNPNIRRLFDNLRISEVHYNPAGADETEFIELHNRGATPLDLTGVRLRNAVDFTFGPMMLGPGAYVVVVRNAAAFQTAYGNGPTVAGQYDGALDNGGERIELMLPQPYDARILNFRYDDSWHPTTDDGGFSLVPNNEAAARPLWSTAAHWRPSVNAGGSPGTLDVNDVTPPPAPTGLGGFIASNSSVQLNWTGVVDPESGVSFYNIYRDNVLIATSVETSYLDEGLATNTPFTYKVSAVNGLLVEGAFSADFMISIEQDGTPPSIPSGVGGQLTAESRLVITWAASVDPQTGVSSYEIFRNGVSIGTTATTTFTDNAMPNTALTEYRIRAINGVGLASPQSAILSVANFQDGVSNGGSIDTWINMNSVNQNNGGTTTLEVDGADPQELLSLIRWNVGLIPDGADVLSAAVTLQISNASADTYPMFQVLRDWVENQATWNIAATGQNWGTAGARGAGDRGTAQMGVFAAPAVGRYFAPMTAAGLDIVELWANGGDNFGLLISNDPATDGFVAASSEAANVNQRPKLTVIYVTTDITPPTVPGNLQATDNGASSITLSWDAASDPQSGVASYNVYRNSNFIGSSIGLNYIDTGRTPGVSYSYTVTAVNGLALESGATAPVMHSIAVDGTPPSMPAGLMATDNGVNTINLSWSAAVDAQSGVASYRVLRDSVQIATGLTNTQYSDTGRTPGEQYSYQVLAVNGQGLAGPASAPAMNYTILEDGTAPSTPMNLQASDNGASTITLSWAAAADPESGVASYNIIRDSVQIATGVVGTNYLDTGRAANVMYEYQVQAVNGQGLAGALSAPLTHEIIPMPVTVNLAVRDSYLPGTPTLVRVEVIQSGMVNRDLWDATATLTSDNPAVTLSTNQVTLVNGLGSVMVTFTGSAAFNLTATVNGLENSRAMTSLSGAPVTTIGAGTLAGASTNWSGVVHVTGNVTVPVGHTLNVAPGTLVLIDGVAVVTNPGANDNIGTHLIVQGTLSALGTAAQPITFTAFNPLQPWGEINVTGEAIFDYTEINIAGNAPRGGHTGTGPAIRANGADVTLSHSSITDLRGKIMQATNDSVIVFSDTLLSRAVMGPEVDQTELHLSDVWIVDMAGRFKYDGFVDDNDGIYMHRQANPATDPILLERVVIAGVQDDGFDTLNSVVTIRDSIARDIFDKGTSVSEGDVTIERSLFIGGDFGVSAKLLSNGATANVRLDHVTVVGSQWAVAAENPSSGTVNYIITNSTLRGVDSILDEFNLPARINITYSNIGEAWPGVGNFNADPLYVDAVNHDYRLQPGSPNIDTGEPTVMDPDGTRTDVGYRYFDQGGPLTGQDDGGAPAGPVGLQALGDGGPVAGSTDQDEEDEQIIDILADLGGDLR